MLIHEILQMKDVPGRLAIVYHRTHTHENVQAIRQDGFQAGDRAMYGKGIYATYSLYSQLTPYMLEQYGEFVIKSKLDLDGFLILEPDVAKKVYGKRWRIADQIADRFEEGRYAGFDTIQKIQRDINDGEPSSTAARQIVNSAMIKRMRGIVYRGNRDGRCVVVYQPDTLVPISWTKITMDDINQIRSNKMVGVAQTEFVSGLKWEKIVNRELIAKSLKPNADRNLVTNPRSIKSIVNPTEEQQMTAVSADPTTIQYIKNPTPQVQATATSLDPDTIRFVSDPTPAAIIWPLKINHQLTVTQWKPETIIAALKMDCTILPAVSRSNEDKKPTKSQWDAAWEAPNANEMIAMYLEQQPNKKFNAESMPHDTFLHVMKTFPWNLHYFENASPDAVAAAVLSPQAVSMGHNLALGNCTMSQVRVDTSAIPSEQLTKIIQQTPNCIFAVADPSIELAKTAMMASHETAKQMAQTYNLPPELQALVPRNLPIFQKPSD